VRSTCDGLSCRVRVGADAGARATSVIMSEAVKSIEAVCGYRVCFWGSVSGRNSLIDTAMGSCRGRGPRPKCSGCAAYAWVRMSARCWRGRSAVPWCTLAGVQADHRMPVLVVVVGPPGVGVLGLLPGYADPTALLTAWLTRSRSAAGETYESASPSESSAEARWREGVPVLRCGARGRRPASQRGR
jgi:hypothetical protein